jgi:hypothetical protein
VKMRDIAPLDGDVGDQCASLSSSNGLMETATCRWQIRGRLEHRILVGISKDRIFIGNISFVPFGTQE